MKRKMPFGALALVSARFLSTAEIRLIKGMLLLKPALTYQQVLSYFTRPGRDINHRVIAEIHYGSFAAIPPASHSETMNYMMAMSTLQFPQGNDFTADDGSGLASQRYVGQLLIDFWPVGQGLFASGALTGFTQQPLTWVFDCGTSSNFSFLNRALAEFGKLQSVLSTREITLAAISHFDSDHINGFVDLLRFHRIRKLLLPYVPLWQRLVVMMEQGILGTDPLVDFYIDPVTYLTERGNIGEVIFVPDSGDATPGPLPSPEEAPRLSPDLDDFSFEDGELPFGADSDPTFSSSSRHKVRILRPGTSLRAAIWEFLPYNDSNWLSLEPVLLEAMVKPYTDKLVNPASDTDRQDALTSIKAEYDAIFGGDASSRNRVSMSLYSGPLHKGMEVKHYLSNHYIDIDSKIFSLLYTGDSSLKTKRSWDAFQQFYSVGGRLSKSPIFQVMHHGAERNWQTGIAATICPAASIFSSDPSKRPWHPHKKVKADFASYHPVQVDTTTGFHFQATLHF